MTFLFCETYHFEFRRLLNFEKGISYVIETLFFKTCCLISASLAVGQAELAGSGLQNSVQIINHPHQRWRIGVEIQQK